MSKRGAGRGGAGRGGVDDGFLPEPGVVTLPLRDAPDRLLEVPGSAGVQGAR